MRMLKFTFVDITRKINSALRLKENRYWEIANQEALEILDTVYQENFGQASASDALETFVIILPNNPTKNGQLVV